MSDQLDLTPQEVVQGTIDDRKVKLFDKLDHQSS